MIDVASILSLGSIVLVGSWVAYSIWSGRKVRVVEKPCIVCVAFRERHQAVDYYKPNPIVGQPPRRKITLAVPRVGTLPGQETDLAELAAKHGLDFPPTASAGSTSTCTSELDDHLATRSTRMDPPSGVFDHSTVRGV